MVVQKRRIGSITARIGQKREEIGKIRKLSCLFIEKSWKKLKNGKKGGEFHKKTLLLIL